MLDMDRSVESPAPPAAARGSRMGTVLVAVALLLAGGGLGWLLRGDPGEQPTETTVATTVPQLADVDEPVAEVAAALLPSVVQIETPRGVGSGFVYDGEGLILTAAHVVAGADEVTVRLADGERVAGRVVGTDPTTDVAVVGVDRSDLTAAPLALDTPIQVGQMAIALGSPWGLDQTVTAGVVSATHRSLIGPDGHARTMIQTDAPINPGNSGGPLADREGWVIGINDSIFSRSGGNNGVGFAVPITVAKEVADQLVAGDPIETAFLGVSGTDTATGTAGARITEIVPGSAAEEAGLRVGDLITAADGVAVRGMVDLAAQVAGRAPGEAVTLEVLRAGRPVEVTVTLGARE
ncbi:MAG: S1C family serine protease [Acidimicrobiia bacterium]